MHDNSNRGLMIAGAMLIAEGAAFAVMGRQYVDFMERKGLMDAGKRLVRRLDMRSPTVFTAIGLAELVWGVVLLRRAYVADAAVVGTSW